MEMTLTADREAYSKESEKLIGDMKNAIRRAILNRKDITPKNVESVINDICFGVATVIDNESGDDSTSPVLCFSRHEEKDFLCAGGYYLSYLHEFVYSEEKEDDKIDDDDQIVEETDGRRKESVHTLNEILNAANPWLAGCDYQLIRDKHSLEPGVNFFVLVLEYFDAKTVFSCEGHPKGFYIYFQCPYKTALIVNALKFFTLELTDKDKWRITMNEEGLEANEDREFTEEDRVRWLSNASLYWKHEILNNGRDI